MSSYKLAFFDIDGTLLGSNGQYSEQTQQAILRLQQQGIKTAIASGRPPFAAKFLIDELKLDDAGLFYAGAMIYDPKKQTIVNSNYLLDQSKEQQSAFENLLDSIETHRLYCEHYIADNYYSNKRPVEIYKAHSAVLRCKANLNFSFESSQTVKLLVGAQVSDFDLAAWAKTFPMFDFAFAKMASHPEWLFASITSHNACRKQGFSTLCEYHDVKSSEVIAFGDAQSDKIFIEQAGFGIAMGDAPEDVKVVSNYVTTTADEEGVAKAIGHLFA